MKNREEIREKIIKERKRLREERERIKREHDREGHREQSREFKINDYITLKLEFLQTDIYVAGERFIQCKGLLLDIPVNNIVKLEALESMDDIDIFAREFHRSTGYGKRIPPETEFWGHCSNIQVWAEHDYDTRLIHTNLAFPLLKRLTEVGDPVAKHVFKDEIGKRLRSGSIVSARYLLIEGYFNYFTKEEGELIFLRNNLTLSDEISDVLNRPKELNKLFKEKIFALELLEILSELGDDMAQSIHDRYVKSLKSSTFTVKKFWDLIERTRKKCNNDSEYQRELLENELKALTLEELYCIHEILNLLSFKLESNQKFLNQPGYLIIALGKEAYMKALYNAEEFTRDFEAGVYGNARFIVIMLNRMVFDAMVEKEGMDAFAFGEVYDELLGERLRGQIEGLKRELDIFHAEIEFGKKRRKKRVKGLITTYKSIPIDKLAQALDINPEDAENLIYELVGGGIGGTLEDGALKYTNGDDEVIKALYDLIDNMN